MFPAVSSHLPFFLFFHYKVRSPTQLPYGSLKPLRYLHNGGWYAGGDKAVSETKRGIMASMTDRGYPSEAFFGAKMQSVAPRDDIQWYPPQSWSKNPSAFELLMNSMKSSYRNAKSDYNKHSINNSGDSVIKLRA